MFGLNVTEMVQLAAGARVEMHVFVWVKKTGDIETPESVSGPVPLFLNVTIFGLLEVATATVPKFRVLGESVPRPLKMPLP